jgi:hypothetical protein
MHNLLKLASEQLDKSSNIIKTAAILRKLKNKILNLFDSSRREKVQELLNKSDQTKPLLAEIYSLIKKLESSIEDLDLEDYDDTVKELKSKIIELNSKLNDVKGLAETSIKEEPKEPEKIEEDWKSSKRKRTKKDEEFKQKKSIYTGISSLSQLNVNSSNIVENKIGPKGIYSSWGFVNFAKTGSDPKALIELQSGLKDDDIRRLFYTDIPNYKIISISPREVAYKDDPSKGWKAGDKKPGSLEIKVQSPIKSLPSPANNWKLSVVFILVDMYGEPTKKGNYRMYRQLVVYAKDEGTGKTETWSESSAANNEQNLAKITPK